MRWLMARKIGNLRWDPRRESFFLDFRSVKFPGVSLPRRVRIFRVSGLGSIGQSREIAEMALDSIRSEYRNGRTLPQVLANYLGDSAPENRFSRHWIRFLDAKSQDARDGEIARTRYRELASYERRGYLDSLWDISVFQISFGVLDDWRRELQRRHSARGGRLSRKTIRHVVSDVGTFMRWLHRRKVWKNCPSFPQYRWGSDRGPASPVKRCSRTI